MKRILVICTGNICRSPMVTGLLSATLASHGYDDIVVESAGTHGLAAAPATSYAREAMQERGIDINDHRSRRLSLELLEEADLVLVMERNHQYYIRSLAPKFADKLHLLSELAGKEYDIRDPYRGSQETYEYIAQELQVLIRNGWQKVIKWLYEDSDRDR